MPPRGKRAQSGLGIAPLLLGAVLVLAGVLMLLFPADLLFDFGDDEGRPAGLFLAGKGQCRLFGAFALVLGATLIWVTRFSRWGARRAALDDYYWLLSQDLARRFGSKQYYALEQVNRIAAESGYSKAYLAYAHAMFCDRGEFDAWYGPLRVACTYDGLRRVISRRYLSGGLGFDAAGIVRCAKPPVPDEYTHGPE